MKVLYTGDNEGPAVMDLETLIANFRLTGVFENSYRVNEDDIRDNLDSRGWHEDNHENGRFLIVNFNSPRIQLVPHPDCPEG